MARRRNPATEYTQLWNAAKSKGISRRVIARDLGMTQGRLNDLILGRSQPTLGEVSAIHDRRRATRVFYEYNGETRSFWTGSGKSYESLMGSSEDSLNDIIQEMPTDSRPMGAYRITGTSPGRPGRLIRVYPMGRSLRSQYSGS